MTDTTRTIEAGARADLLPCPFCGSDDIITADNVEVWGQASDQVYARCNKCGANGPSAYTDPNALTKWNARPAIASGALVPASAGLCAAELRTQARLTWNGWPDNEQSRKSLAEAESKDDISRAAWDRVVAAILTATKPALSLDASHNSGERLLNSDVAEDRAGTLIASAVAEMRERCAKVADMAKVSNISYALEYPDEAVKFENRSHRAKTIADAIRQLDTAPASGDYVVVPRGNLTAMAQFVMWAMNTGPWDGCGLDGGDVQDKAEELGLIVKTKHDPKIHGDRIEAEAGDDWFVPPEWLTVVLNAASSNGGGK